MTELPIHRVIAGYGRSGTTWVQDAVAKANSLRAVFEPLHPSNIDGAGSFAHRYISEGREEPELHKHLNKFFCENFHSLWADYRVVRNHLSPRNHDLMSWQGCLQFLRRYREFKDNYLQFYRQRRHPQRVIKLIRSNMMLSWLRASFNARIVFVIRHPVAVVLSQLRSRRWWNPYDYIDRYRSDSDLLGTLDAKTKHLLLHSIDDVEAYALCWCIENKVALEQVQKCGIPIVHYELLLLEGFPEWQRIVSALELKQVPGEQLVSQPSQQTWGQKATDVTRLRRHDSWMDDIDETILARIQRILDATSMTIYTVDNSLPIVDKLVSH
jgi:Sulfotransferase family